MKEINTNISYGYLSLIEIFAKANNLDITLGASNNTKLKISYDPDSATAIQITFMSLRHCGFENMLTDYLLRCGIESHMIPVGKFIMRRSETEMEEDWQKHKKRLGLHYTSL